MNKWIEELKQLDPKNPSNWPWPFKAGGLLLLFLAVLAAGWFSLFSTQLEELDKEKRKEAELKAVLTEMVGNVKKREAGAVPGRGDRRRSKEHDRVVADLRSLPQQELARLIQTLEEEMNLAASELRFEYAARLRDEVKELRRELRDAL